MLEVSISIVIDVDVQREDGVAMNIVVLDIGGTSIKSGFLADGKLCDIRERPTDAKKGGLHVIGKAKEIIGEYSKFERIGISTAGQVDSERGSIRYANENIPGYTGMDIRGILEKSFNVPVVVENDVNAAAIGEASFGAGKDYNDFLCLTYGTGVGGAIILNKKVYTGSMFSAGEFGGIVIHGSSRNVKKDVFSGCYEKYASTTALVKKAMEFDKTLDNGRKIFERIEEDAVRIIVDKWIGEIALGLVSLIHIFNPTCIVLGGGIMKQKYILEKLNDLLYDNIMSSFHNVVLRQAELGNTAGLWGAGKVAQDMLC